MHRRISPTAILYSSTRGRSSLDTDAPLKLKQESFHNLVWKAILSKETLYTVKGKKKTSEAFEELRLRPQIKGNKWNFLSQANHNLGKKYKYWTSSPNGNIGFGQAFVLRCLKSLSKWRDTTFSFLKARLWGIFPKLWISDDQSTYFPTQVHLSKYTERERKKQQSKFKTRLRAPWGVCMFKIKIRKACFTPKSKRLCCLLRSKASGCKVDASICSALIKKFHRRDHRQRGGKK